MQVNFSLVGYGVDNVGLTVAEGGTVKDVLDAFMAASEFPFSYQVVPSPFRKNVNLVFAFTYKGITLSSILAHAVGTEERVWQFYVSDSNGVHIPNNYDQKRRPFDQFVLSEGYTVKWRLVTVIKQPIEIVKRVRNNTTPEQSAYRTQTYKI